METATMRLYEAMFLVDSAQAAGDWDGTMGAIETVLKRADAEVLTLRKWSERRLAYEMGKVARGTYLLCYFRADPLRIADLEKDVRLSEMILRVLVLAAEERPEGFNEKDMTEKAEVADKTMETAEDSDKPEIPSAPESVPETSAAPEVGGAATEASGAPEKAEVAEDTAASGVTETPEVAEEVKEQ